jgi:MoaA/NifB/PqqE/SkfB family radical SAM enzyme
MLDMKYKILEVYLNFSCNQRCFMCFNTDEFRSKNKDLNLSDIAAHILKSAKKGFNWLSIVGGEPTIHPEILNLVSFAKKCGYRKIITFSNGQRYSDMDFLKKMKIAGLSGSVISMHGHNAALHESVTNVKGSFNMAVLAIKNLAKFKMDISVIIVVNKKNYRYKIEMLDFFNKLGVYNFMLFFLKYQGRVIENLKENKKFLIKITEAFKDTPKVIDFCRRKKIIIPSIVHVPPCILPGYESILDNYITKDASMILQDKEVFDIGKAHQSYGFKKLCRECVYFEGCSGYDLEYAKIFGDLEFKPIFKKPSPFYNDWSKKDKRLIKKN